LPPTTLIAITISFYTFALSVAAIIIHGMLLLLVVAHCRGCVVAFLTLSHQSPPAFADPITG
jgi:hypothetical protein